MTLDIVLSMIKDLGGEWTPIERVSLVMALLRTGWIDVDAFRRAVDAADSDPEDSDPEDTAGAHRIGDAIEALSQVVHAETAAYRSREGIAAGVQQAEDHANRGREA